VGTSVKQKQVRHYFAKAWISGIFSANTYTCHFFQRQDYVRAPVKYLPFIMSTHPYLEMYIRELTGATWTSIPCRDLSYCTCLHSKRLSRLHHGVQHKFLSSLIFQFSIMYVQ